MTRKKTLETETPAPEVEAPLDAEIPENPNGGGELVVVEAEVNGVEVLEPVNEPLGEDLARKFIKALADDFDLPADPSPERIPIDLLRAGIVNPSVGQIAIAQLREKSPRDYLKLYQSLMPKEVTFSAGGSLGSLLRHLNTQRKKIEDARQRLPQLDEPSRQYRERPFTRRPAEETEDVEDAEEVDE